MKKDNLKESDGITDSEYNLIDIFFSRLRKVKQGNRTVQFDEFELEEILGVEKGNIEKLKTSIKDYFSISGASKIEKNKETWINYFESVDAFSVNGNIVINIECTVAAIDYYHEKERSIRKY